MSQSSSTMAATTTSAASPTVPPTTAIPINPDFLCQPAPSDTTEINIDPPWEPGVVRDLEVDLRDYGRGTWAASASQYALALDIELAVHNAQDDELHFDWNQRSVDINPAGTTRADFDNPSAEFWGRASLSYDVDPDTARPLVTNSEAVQSNLRSSLLEEAESASPDDVEWLTLSADLVSSLRDHDIQRLAQPAMLLHSAELVHVEVDKTNVVDTFVTTQFGPGLLPARSSHSVTDLVGEDGCVIVDITTILHPHDAEAVAQAILDNAFGSGVYELSPSLTLSMRTGSTVHYDYSTGFIKSISSELFLELDQTSKVLTIEIADITDRARQ